MQSYPHCRSTNGAGNSAYDKHTAPQVHKAADKVHMTGAQQRGLTLICRYDFALRWPTRGKDDWITRSCTKFGCWGKSYVLDLWRRAIPLRSLQHHPGIACQGSGRWLLAGRCAAKGHNLTEDHRSKREVGKCATIAGMTMKEDGLHQSEWTK